MNIDVIDSIDFASLSETKSVTAERKEKLVNSRAKGKAGEQQSERKSVTAERNRKSDSRAKGNAGQQSETKSVTAERKEKRDSAWRNARSD